MKGDPLGNIVCLKGYLCLTEYCDIQRECSIYRKVTRMSNNRRQFYNYGRHRGHDHIIDGKMLLSDARQLFLTSLKSGFICPECGTKMLLGGNSAQAVTIDHILSRKKGGKNNRENLRVCCSECNQEKSKREDQLSQIKTI